MERPEGKMGQPNQDQSQNREPVVERHPEEQGEPDFCEILRDLRKKRRMTQGQVAKKVGVSVSLVSQWERAIVRPTPDSVDALSELFGITLEDRMSRSTSRRDSVESTVLRELRTFRQNFEEWSRKFARQNNRLVELEQRNDRLVRENYILKGENSSLQLEVDVLRSRLKSLSPKALKETES